MFCVKKTIAIQGKYEQEHQIDFVWLYYIAMNKLRFTYKETGMLAFGEWLDFFETFKGQYNFEIRKGIYDIKNADTVDSLDSI